MPDELPLSQQARLLKWAVDQDLLSRAEAGAFQAADTPTLSEADLADQFRAHFLEGKLKDSLARALEADHPFDAADHPDATLPILNPGCFPGGSSPLPSADPEGFPLPSEGRYLPLAFLGEGGMGRVYKAFDQQVKRVVALKFLLRVEPARVERFLTEGRAQAQIDHPNICSIYSVEESQGQPFFSMRFIDGPTLKEALPRLNLEQKVRIIAQVALALHTCHRQGILHRDIKPANIMLEPREDGSWWPFLMDFGVARDLSDVGRTVQGVMLGTPMYCSPEQVQGRLAEVDRRSDTYSLGATLYESLTGQAPFSVEDGLMRLIQRVCTEDPATLPPGLPRELQIIVLKAMEKDPARRYPSARALGEDLQRYLDGDPILAHRPSLGYRLAKRFRKNRALTLVALGSAVLALGFAAFGFTMAWRGRVLSQSGLHFAREAEQMEGILQKAYGLPLHDIRPQRTRVLAQLERIRASLPQLGRWSQPAAHLALGRGYLALDRLEEARRELEVGCAGTPRDPDTALALGLTLARLYQAELEGLRGKSLEDKTKDVEGSLRRPALDCLHRAEGAHQDGPAYVQGVLALVEGRYPDAIRHARDYREQAPWAYDASVLEADADRALAGNAFAAGNVPLGDRFLAQARTTLAQAREVARSAPPVYLAEVQLQTLDFQVRSDRGLATQEDRDRALEATQQCLGADPENWKALSYQAAIHRRWAVQLLNQGGDPGPSLEAAIASAERGLAYRPQDNPLWNNLGSILRNRADWEFNRGQDPTATLTRAIQALHNALNRPQFKDWLLDSIGCCYSLLGRYLMEHGQDPTAALASAADNLNQAQALKPWVGHVATLGECLQNLAEYQTWHRQDPLPALDQAQTAFQAALDLSPKSYLSHQGMAKLLLDRAEALLARGRPAQSDLAQAQAHLEMVQRLNPSQVGPVQAALARTQALRALAADSNRAAALAAARVALTRARPLVDKPATAIALAEVCLLIHRADPSGPELQQGLALLGPALAKRPWDGQGAFLEGRLLSALGREEQAEKRFLRAAALNPNLVHAER